MIHSGSARSIKVTQVNLNHCAADLVKDIAGRNIILTRSNRYLIAPNLVAAGRVGVLRLNGVVTFHCLLVGHGGCVRIIYSPTGAGLAFLKGRITQHIVAFILLANFSQTDIVHIHCALSGTTQTEQHTQNGGIVRCGDVIGQMNPLTFHCILAHILGIDSGVTTRIGLQIELEG